MLQRYTVPGQYIESAPNGYLNQASQAVEGCKVSWQNTAAESREAEEISAICALFRFRLVSDLLIDVTLIKAMLDGPENARVSRFSFCRDAQRS